MALQVKVFSMFSDNFGFLLIDDKTRYAALVDPGDARVCLEEVEKNNVSLKAIFNTHHHSDHAGGNQEVLLRYPQIEVFAGEHDKNRIFGASKFLKHGDQVKLGETVFDVLFVPGHTRGHIAYYTPHKLFCGDTLFVAGCGRLFEGTAEQMFHSLCLFAQLPDETEVYCAHEYTISNLNFCLSINPQNPDLLISLERAKKELARGGRTVPSTIGVEKIHNPFLRAATVADFAELRSAKDQFKS